MEYTLLVRAFLEVNRKEKANAHAEKLFPGLPVENVGRYWKNNDQWEIRICKPCEYADDKAALWETLIYFRSVLPWWQITVCANDGPSDALVAAIGDNRDGTVLKWCSFELLRGSANHPNDET